MGEPIHFIHGHHNKGPKPRRRKVWPVLPPGLCECGCGHVTKRVKKSWAAYGLVAGNYNRYIKGHDKRKTPHEYVEEDRGFTSPCWIWTRAHTGAGYGAISDPTSGKLVQAHRFYYEREHGDIADGLFLDHLCRQHACVRPSHLQPVTPRENSRRSTNAKLTPVEVLAIRSSTVSHERLGVLYGVAESTIRNIRTGKTWANLSEHSDTPWVIYALCDPDTGDVRYIGKSNNIAQRFHAHMKVGGKDTTARAAWVLSLRIQGKRPVLRILEEWASDAEARTAERRLIEAYRGDSITLLNDRSSTSPVPERSSLAWTDTHRFRMHPELQARGESVKTAKLTNSTVRAIREMYATGGVSGPKLAAVFGVSYATIYAIISRKTWKHVT